MDAKTIIKVLEELIGPVKAIGETEADKRALENLITAEQVTWYLMQKMHYALSTKDKYEASMKEVGTRAEKAIMDICNEFMPEDCEGGK